MITPQLLLVDSKEDLYSKLDEVANIFRKNSIVCVRGVKFTEEDQIQLTRDLGDIVGWYPNNALNFNHKYVENHSNNSKNSEEVSGDTLILDWHLEHVDYDRYIPLVAGVWNMRIFKYDKSIGKTYFMDSRSIYETLFSSEEKEFMSNCVVTWYEDSEDYPLYVDLIQPHWLSGDLQIRIELHHLKTTKLYTFKGETPSFVEIKEFYRIVKKFTNIIFNNTNLRIVHEWQEGDILIPDLFALAHAVTGGFNPEKREFTGFWCYSTAPDLVSKEKIFPKW